jgi:hypothetical protein
MGVGYIQFDQGREQSLYWRPAIKLLDSVLPLQVVYIAREGSERINVRI